MSFFENIKNSLNTNPFKGFFKKNRLRPPGALSEKQFMELCIRCARCIEICPYESIKRADLFDSLQIGTPYIYATDRACYLCMKCPPVCPTGALDPKMIFPEKINIGKAVINQNTCLNYIYVNEEETGKITGGAMICSTCYNVCPFTDEAIVMKDFLLPVITEKCVGCGICVEKCPVDPEKAINIIPEGMDDIESAGYYYRKSKVIHEESHYTGDILTGEDLIKKKQGISSFGVKPEFKSDFHIQEEIEDWD